MSERKSERTTKSEGAATVRDSAPSAPTRHSLTSEALSLSVII